MKAGCVQSAEILQQLKEMKKSERALAIASGISIQNMGSEALALIPIGSWILDDTDLVALMARWRGRAMAFFFHQFEASPESMADYLDHYAVQKADRLLFLVFVDGSPVGHIGLSNIRAAEAMLDNMVRGESGGPEDLMLEAERRVIRWASEELGVETITLAVQSRNFLAKRLHKKLGFVVCESLFLRKVSIGNYVRLEPCSISAATEAFTMEVMSLNLNLLDDGAG